MKCSFINISVSHTLTLSVFLCLSPPLCWHCTSRESTDWESHMAGNKPRAGFMSTLCCGSGTLPPHLKSSSDLALCSREVCGRELGINMTQALLTLHHHQPGDVNSSSVSSHGCRVSSKYHCHTHWE